MLLYISTDVGHFWIVLFIMVLDEIPIFTSKVDPIFIRSSFLMRRCVQINLHITNGYDKNLEAPQRIKYRSATQMDIVIEKIIRENY